MDAFACPLDCGWCCTHLEREEDPGERDFRDAMRGEGVYSCGHPPRGISLSHDEARAMRDEASRRGLRAKLHPRTFLLDSRRRAAVVLDWHWDHVACPFYADYKCTAYEVRPLVCRAFPVMLGAPLRLAPQCPKTPIPRGALKGELKARKAIELRDAGFDEAAFRLLAAPGFAKGLPAAEARRRLKRYRWLSPEEHPSCAAPARSSTS